MKSIKRKPGRPKLPERESKRKIVPIRLDAGDLTLAMNAARASKQELSGWIRDMLRTMAERQLFRRTLHEAMETVLRERPDFSATASDLSEAIRQRALYTRKDGKSPKAQQINARARKYPGIFLLTEAGFIQLKTSPRAASPSESPDLDFHPITIPGEPLSATILRERR
jgi:hypothetical protein